MMKLVIQATILKTFMSSKGKMTKLIPHACFKLVITDV